MFLLTNDRSPWLDNLKALLKADGWNTIRTSRDLELDQVQLDVSNAVSYPSFSLKIGEHLVNL
jgi:hypothetical protein